MQLVARSKLVVLGLALGAVVLGGCNHHVYSPPARTFSMQGPASLPRGRSAFGMEAGANAAAFGPTVAAGTARYRRGLTDEVEINVEGSVMGIVEEPAEDVSQLGAVGRLGVHYSPSVFARHVGITAGLGGGGWAAGGLLAGDLGLIVGYENPYFVPRFGVQFFVSQPIAARAIDTTAQGEDDDPEHRQTPITTYGFQFDAGFKIPIRQAANLYMGALCHYLTDGVQYEVFWGGMGGFEILFG